VTRDFAPKWGITCKVQKATSIPKGAWAIVILDDPDEPNAAGYHDLTPDGLPLSKVFVAAGDVSVTASHELLEMLVDPAINCGCQQADQKTWVALEVCDAVEETTYKIDGVTASRTSCCRPTSNRSAKQTPTSSIFGAREKAVSDFEGRLSAGVQERTLDAGVWRRKPSGCDLAWRIAADTAPSRVARSCGGRRDDGAC
jgi:hypothetical protein